MKVAEDPRAVVVLTPEHVPIRLTPAGLGARFVALLVDFGITMSLILAAAAVGAGGGLLTVAVFLIQWGYPMYFEVRHRGQTPGKRLFGLRVVDLRGLPITFQQSFVRNIVRVLDFAPLFYGLGGFVCMMNRHHRRLGDIVAETMVIEERAAADPTRAIADARRFNSLQTPRVLRRLRRQVGLEERELLLALVLRMDRMDPQARFDLTEEVGGYYRKTLEIDDPHLSGENIVRGLLSLLYTDRS